MTKDERSGKQQLKQKYENLLYTAKTLGLATIALGAANTHFLHDFFQEHGHISPDILAYGLATITPLLGTTIYCAITGRDLRKEYELANRPLAKPVTGKQPAIYGLSDSGMPLESLLE